jgi:holo-[acyl-carrier protein] synthase
MIVGLGIDLVAIAKLEPNLQRERYLARLFTPAEIAACRGTARPAEHFAGKFAVKEAFMKALGAGLRQGVAFSQIEVLDEASGRPQARAVGGVARQGLEALQATAIHVSLSHGGGMAVAVVILERETDP